MERDDLIVNDQYSIDNHHGAEEGARIRKKIIQVTLLLTAITTIEVFMGIEFKHSSNLWEMVKWSFIVMTLIKAGYIVMVFMHLKDERKNLRNVILIPYFIFAIYLAFIGIQEGMHMNYMLNFFH